jgi:transcription elongation factor Elf1
MRIIMYKSEHPCEKCNQMTVEVSLEDESDGNGTYYDIRCTNCGMHYKVDGPDA